MIAKMFADYQQVKQQSQGDHSPDNVTFPDISLAVCGTRQVNCYSYHVCNSLTVSGGGRNATVHDPKPYI